MLSWGHDEVRLFQKLYGMNLMSFFTCSIYITFLKIRALFLRKHLQWFATTAFTRGTEREPMRTSQTRATFDPWPLSWLSTRTTYTAKATGPATLKRSDHITKIWSRNISPPSLTGDHSCALYTHRHYSFSSNTLTLLDSILLRIF